MATDVSYEQGTSNRVRILLVDHRHVLREGLRALLDQQPGLEVVADVVDASDAAHAEASIDVIVTELESEGGRGVTAIRNLRAAFPDAAILVLTRQSHPSEVDEALSAGAAGYLIHTATAPELVNGIRTLASGQAYLQPSLGVELARWHQRRTAAPGLSPREEQLVRLLAVGHTNAEVAKMLEVSLRTVEMHRARVQAKTGLRSRAELFRFARDAGLLGVDYG